MTAAQIIAKILVALGEALVDRIDDITPADAARTLVGIGLAFVPVEDLRQYLDEEARKRAEAVADAAEALKFGGGS